MQHGSRAQPCEARLKVVMVLIQQGITASGRLFILFEKIGDKNDEHIKCLVGEMIQHIFLFKISLKKDSNFGKFLTLKKKQTC
jgi:hypothetical protein